MASNYLPSLSFPTKIQLKVHPEVYYESFFWIIVVSTWRKSPRRRSLSSIRTVLILTRLILTLKLSSNFTSLQREESRIFILYQSRDSCEWGYWNSEKVHLGRVVCLLNKLIWLMNSVYMALGLSNYRPFRAFNSWWLSSTQCKL